MNKTEKVKQRVIRDILYGKYQPGSKIPGEREMAADTGTSRITIRRAYAALEEAGILERVQGSGTYVSKTPRGNPATSAFIALLASVRDPFILEFVSALERSLSEEGMLLVLRLTDEDPRVEEQAVIDLVARGVMNLVIWPSGQRFPADTFARLRILGVNMVFFDRVIPGPFADFVGLDNRRAIRALLDHVQDKGYTDVVLVSYGGLEVDSIKQREDEFRDECRARALRHRVERVPYQGDIRTVLREHAKDWFTQPRRQAVMCVNDPIALQVRAVLGQAFPVYGIDGLPKAVAAGIVTYRQPMAYMAERIIQLLCEQRWLGPKWKADRVYCTGELLNP